MSDLERAGFIRGTPTDPRDIVTNLMADGRIEVQHPEQIYFITKVFLRARNLRNRRVSPSGRERRIRSSTAAWLFSS